MVEVMIDMLVLRIPFKPYLVNERLDSAGNYVAHVDLTEVARRSGLILSAHSVEYAIDGDLTVSGLKHRYESLASHYTGVAFKLFEGGMNCEPCVELKASPAKILQGHNVFGPTDFELCSLEFFGILSESMPDLYELLDIPNTSVSRIDVTFSARVQTQAMANQVINYLRNVSNGQTKKTKAQDYDTTVTWNGGSRHRTLVSYLKWNEMQAQITRLRRKKSCQLSQYEKNALHVLSNPDLQEFAVGLVRFEARLHTRFLESFGLPRNLINFVKYQKSYPTGKFECVCDLWKKAFKDIFVALEGAEMNIYDDSKVYDSLCDAFSTVTKNGNISKSKPNRLFGFYRRLVNEGYDNVAMTMDRMTFWRHEKDLISVGLSKAQLKNLTAEKNNVVPFIRAINVDFMNQYPSWYQEPMSRYA
ncbi:TPA: phage/plasmid replication protein, II/X family [Salmonella enterica subsp. enterica serovar Bareilly]